jgi:hypothetical protein
MAIAASTATSITVTIRTMVTEDRCQSAERRRSVTFTRTKRGMGEATQATQVTMGAANTALDMREAATPGAVMAAAIMAAVITRE